MAAPILIGTDSFICVVVVIYNLMERRLYLHETFLTEKIPEIAASSLVRGGKTASPQSPLMASKGRKNIQITEDMVEKALREGA